MNEKEIIEALYGDIQGGRTVSLAKVKKIQALIDIAFQDGFDAGAGLCRAHEIPLVVVDVLEGIKAKARALGEHEIDLISVVIIDQAIKKYKEDGVD